MLDVHNVTTGCEAAVPDVKGLFSQHTYCTVPFGVVWRVGQCIAFTTRALYNGRRQEPPVGWHQRTEQQKQPRQNTM